MLLAQPAQKKAQYTYVSQWGVPRGMWAEYEKSAAVDVDILGKAVVDGTLVSFGTYSVLAHQEGQPTHGIWFSAMSMAGLMKGLEALRAAPQSPVLGSSKHSDVILRSTDYNGHAGTFKNGYLRVGTWNYKAGASDPGGQVTKATMSGMFEKLLDEGALHAYQIDTETVHSADPGAVNLVIIANGAEGIDKFDAAIDEMQKTNPAGEKAFGSLFTESGHRDMLARVDMMTHK